MSEAEYMALHQHPSPEFIAENLKQRMDAVQQFALNAAAREQLEAHLRRQNEAGGLMMARPSTRPWNCG